MSASNRRFTCSFVWAAGGRPRLGLSISFAAASPSRPGSTSFAGRALANHSSLASGASSSINSGSGLRGMSTPFALIGAAQADHVNSLVARREHKHVQVFANPAQRLVSVLRVRLAGILGNQRAAPVKLRSQVKREAAFGDVALVLHSVVGQAHALLYPQ